MFAYLCVHSSLAGILAGIGCLTYELNAKRGQYYQLLIRVVQRICELGCLDVRVGVLMLLQYVISPHEGHLQQLFHIFAYLKHHTWSKMVFNDPEPVYNENSFKKCDRVEY